MAVKNNVNLHFNNYLLCIVNVLWSYKDFKRILKAITLITVEHSSLVHLWNKSSKSYVILVKLKLSIMPPSITSWHSGQQLESISPFSGENIYVIEDLTDQIYWNELAGVAAGLRTQIFSNNPQCWVHINSIETASEIRIKPVSDGVRQQQYWLCYSAAQFDKSAHILTKEP